MLTNIKELTGRIIEKIEITAPDNGIIFHCNDGNTYMMYHTQECCEDVFIEDICGNINNLIGSPIIIAEESNNYDKQLEGYDYSFTWTFYNFATVKGYVTIRWYGSSNGYYSESVDFIKLDN